MSSKIVVVDGLARSGTTLLSSVIHSQERSGCYRGMFHELLACDIGAWKHDYIMKNIIPANNIGFNNKTNKFARKLKRFFNKYDVQYDVLISNSLKTLCKREQFSQITGLEWHELLNKKVNSFNDLDNLYQEIAIEAEVDILAFRWNQGLAYINKFLRNENHYWISIIRNPMDRSLSDLKTFSSDLDKCVLYTEKYGDKLLHTEKLKNHIIIYYEDLLINPNKVINYIYEYLNLNILDINFDLIQQSGEKYKVESSDLIDYGKKHTEGEEFKGFDLNKVGKYKTELSDDYIKKFENVMKNNHLYSRYL